MTNTKKTDKTVQYTTFASAVQASYPATQTWSFKGVVYSRDELVTLAQGCVTAIQNSAAAHTAWLAATGDEEAKTKAFAHVLAGFKQSLDLASADASTVLPKYGFSPPKVRTQSAESKAAAAAKAKATKAAKKAALAAVGKTPGTAAPAPAPAAATPATGPSKS